VSSEYFLDGVDLDSPGRWRVMKGTLLPEVPAPRLESTEVPSRSGVVDGPGKRVGTFKVTVAFMVEGANRGELDRNWYALLARLRSSGRLAALQHRPAGATPKETTVRLVSVSQPQWQYGEWAIDATAVFEAVEGVWKDAEPTEANLTDLAALKGGAAPITDPLLRLYPTANIVTVKDKESGTSLTWRGSVNGGQRLLVDVARYEAWKIDADRWAAGNGAQGASSGLSMSPGGFQLTPDSEGNVSVEITGGTGVIRARRAY
jgi:hypothetical protein